MRTYEAIVKGHNVPKPGVPESFKVLVKELQALCLDVQVLDREGNQIELKEDDDDVYQPDRIRDDDDFYGYNSGGESDFTEAGFTLKEGSDDDDLAASDSAGDEDDGYSGDDSYDADPDEMD